MRFLDLNEGPNDPNIFKAVILAGGPGSGKSYVATELGLQRMGLRVINSDDAFEHLMRKKNLDLTMPDSEQKERDVERNRAKRIADTKQNLAIDGRLGLIIDGTAKDVAKTAKVKSTLEQLGYDVMMLFVDTSLSTAMQRNNMRPRRVPAHVVAKSHKQVQDNKLMLRNLFGNRFLEVNNEGISDFAHAEKAIRKFLNSPLSPIAKDWLSKHQVREEIESGICEDVSPDQLSQIEKYADVLFNKVGIDVAFTRHFLDRVNDMRNGKPINTAELIRLFRKEYEKWGKPIARLGPDAEAVMRDMQTDVNMPFVLKWDRRTQNLDLVAKTVMRKPNFKTPDPVFAVEAEKTLRNTNPCWKGYTPVGTKKKSGRTVPNCVPEALTFPIPRDQMPQIDIEHVQDDFRVRRGTVSFKKLRPVQTERVPGLVDKTIDMILGNKIDKPIMIDQNGYIVNGHHRYDAYKKLGVGPDFAVPVAMIYATLEDIIAKYQHTTSDAPVVSEASLKKNKWGLIISDEDKTKWGSELIDLVNNAYMNASLGSFVQNLYAVKGSEWVALDWDNDPDIDCTIFFRKNRAGESWTGFKVQGIGHDGSPESKSKVLNRLVLSLNKPGYWIESSDALARALAKRGAEPVRDEALCKAIFPDTNLVMLDPNTGLYQREVDGRVIKEIIYGKPKAVAPVTETCAGSIATVVAPLGAMQRRPNPSIYNHTATALKSRKKKK